MYRSLCVSAGSGDSLLLSTFSVPYLASGPFQSQCDHPSLDCSTGETRFGTPLVALALVVIPGNFSVHYSVGWRCQLCLYETHLMPGTTH